MLMGMRAEEVHIREHALPGIGRRFDLDVGDGAMLIVVTRRDGSREISVREKGADEPRGAILLHREQAVAVGSLLLGATFSDDDSAPTSVDVATVLLGPDSPAVGRLPGEVDLPGGADAAVVAVARDDTPQLLEDDRTRPFAPGDRLVIAARPDRLDEVLHHLAG